MNCAFAACHGTANDVRQILQDGGVFYCCQKHHEVIALVTSEDANGHAEKQIRVSHTQLFNVGHVNRLVPIPNPDVVYFMRRSDGHIKIGFSNNVDRRRRELESHFGSLEVLLRPQDSRQAVNALRRWSSKRWLHRFYAWVMCYFWLPCPSCGRYFGAHEWRDIDGHLSSIPTGIDEDVVYVSEGICPRCTKTGVGDRAWASFKYSLSGIQPRK